LKGSSLGGEPEDLRTRRRRRRRRRRGRRKALEAGRVVVLFAGTRGRVEESGSQ